MKDKLHFRSSNNGVISILLLIYQVNFVIDKILSANCSFLLQNMLDGCQSCLEEFGYSVVITSILLVYISVINPTPLVYKEFSVQNSK